MAGAVDDSTINIVVVLLLLLLILIIITCILSSPSCTVLSVWIVLSFVVLLSLLAIGGFICVFTENASCRRSGVFLQPGTNCKSYYVCVQHGTSWHQFFMSCPRGKKFNTAIAACEKPPSAGHVCNNWLLMNDNWNHWMSNVYSGALRGRGLGITQHPHVDQKPCQLHVYLPHVAKNQNL